METRKSMEADYAVKESFLLRKHTMDWNLLWKQRILRYQMTNQGGSPLSHWESRKTAIRYLEMANETQQGRIKKILEDLPLTKQSKVLDIGAGPGVLAIPMARFVDHVTALDASPGMVDLLKENAKSSGLDNINCIVGRWEDVDPVSDLWSPYDIVIASLSLMKVFDLSAAVDKMEQVANGHIFLYWFSGETSWEAWNRHFRPFSRHSTCGNATLPKFGLLRKILRQKGIEPDIEAFPYVHIDHFANFEDVVDYFAERFEIPYQNRGPALLDCIQRISEPQKNGFVIRSRAVCRKIHWYSRGFAELLPEIDIGMVDNGANVLLRH